MIYVSPLLERVGVPHAFSTRVGGVSNPPFDSLNLGNPSGTETQDEWGSIHENYRRLQAAIGCDDRNRAWVHQVHGGEVLSCDGSFESGAKADAMVTDDPKRLLSVRVADCVPILLATEDGRRVVAVHAGWRGVIAAIVPKAAEMLNEGQTRNVIAAIGPCISMDAFEVGPEVLGEFRRVFGDLAPATSASNGKGHVDLRAAVRMQLLRAGIVEQNIDTTDRCTARDADEFFSHRRDKGVTGRMAAVIGVKI